MDFPIIHFLITVILFFPVLYLIVVPMFRKISMMLFDRGFRVGGFNPNDYHGENAVDGFDVLMTYICFGVTLGVSMAIVVYAAELGIIPPVPFDK